MNILSVSTISERAEVALKTDNSYEERIIDGIFSPSEDLLNEVKSLLKRAKLELKDLNLLLCPKGPGSFTGLRIAMSLLKGISLALDVPLISIDTFSIIENTIPSTDYCIISLIDAKRKRFYYRTKKDKSISETKDAEVDEILNFIDNEKDKILLTGPDAFLFYEKIKDKMENKNVTLDPLSPRPFSKSLITLGIEKYNKGEFDNDTDGPVYIRKSDAEEMLDRRKNNEV